MKKQLAMVLALTCLLGAAGCGAEMAPEEETKWTEESTQLAKTPVQQAGEPTEDESVKDEWGLTLSAEMTDTGMTLVATQSGGTLAGELETGSPFWLETLMPDGQWEKTPTLFPDEEIAWTSEAWMIPRNDSVEWKVNWTYLYGELEPGCYRIGKEIMLFRGPGDSDTRTYYAEFAIVD